MKRRAALALVAALVVMGCAPSVEEQVANRIRAAASPVVREVVYRPGNFLDPPQIDVILIAGATNDQAETLWCDVIAAAGGTPYEGRNGVAIWNDAETEMIAVDPLCATPS